MLHDMLIELVDFLDTAIRQALAEGDYKLVAKLAGAASNIDSLLSE